jgi:hypothetical protein
MHDIICDEVHFSIQCIFFLTAKNTPAIVSTTQESGLKENTVMIGGIDPEPRYWNSKSLRELNGS